MFGWLSDGGVLRLGAEPGQEGRVAGVLAAQHLHGDRPVQRECPCPARPGPCRRRRSAGAARSGRPGTVVLVRPRGSLLVTVRPAVGCHVRPRTPFPGPTVSRPGRVYTCAGQHDDRPAIGRSRRLAAPASAAPGAAAALRARAARGRAQPAKSARPHQSSSPWMPGGQAKTATTCAGCTRSWRPSRRFRCTCTKPVARVALEGDEEQPGVQPAEPVGAVDEAVAAAQDRRPRSSSGWRGTRASSPGSRARRRPASVKSTGSNSSACPSGAPGALGAADGPLLLVEGRGVPGLDEHPDSAGDQVGAAGQPVGPASPSPDPHEPVQRRLVLGLEVVGAVLEAEEVARGRLGRAGGRRPAEAELRPAHAHHAGAEPDEVADGVHRDLRVVRAGLDAQVAAADRRVELVAGERRQSASGAGRRAARPNRSSPSAVGTASARTRRSASARTPAARSPHRCRPAGRTARRPPRRPGRRPARPSSAGRRRSRPSSSRRARRGRRW